VLLDEVSRKEEKVAGRRPVTILAFAVALACTMAPPAAPTLAAQSTQTEVVGPALVTVTGEAEVRVVPDEVVLTLGVETWDQSLGRAKQANDAAVQRLLDEPSVCSVQVLGLQPTGDRAALPQRSKCATGVATVTTETPVLHEGQTIARVRLGFDAREADQLWYGRRRLMATLIAVQVVAGVLVLAGVLSWRLLRPVDRLKRQASSLVSREPTVPVKWERRDELGQLGQHLNEVRERLVDLIGELEGKNAQLRKMAMYDHLTGLPNRTLFRELFQHEAAQARRARRSMALLFIDLDRFKAINDTLG